MAGLNDSNYDHYVPKQIQTFIKEEKGIIKIQGTLQQSPNIDTPRLHLIDIANAKSVEIEVSFKNFNKVKLAYFCTKDVYIEGKGKNQDGHWMITDISKIEEIK
ncbi:MAG: hypothetical protein HRT88_19345 [Lentisphaeraceae bacterium]|nr:hypothetical protein [Lentisphaeraceae bacterium]